MGHLWLIGMMGAGKTAVGRRVADDLGMPFVDVDEEIAARLGCSIGQLWGRQGEQAFRDLEAAALAGLAEGPPSVIATGGGAVLREANVTVMRASGTVIWLRAAPEVLAARVGRGGGRPLLAEGEPIERLAAILDERRERYEAAAHRCVDGDAATVAALAGEVVAVWTGS